MIYDVVVIGGGPAGLSAALTFGRARRTALVCDSGVRRNALATNVNNFLTRDGIAPAELRAIAKEQLEKYPTVEHSAKRVDAVTGERGRFIVTFDDGRTVMARRVLLANGVIDEMEPIEGFREFWGKGIYQCPYCHGWEARDGAWGYLATAPEMIEFALFLRSWSKNVTVFTNGALALPEATRARLLEGAVRIEERPIKRLSSSGEHLERVELAGGESLECTTLFAHVKQSQVPVVAKLGLTLDAFGLVKVDEMTRETSRPGITAAGDLVTRAQGAILAAAAGTFAAAMLTHSLALDRSP